MVIRSRSLHVWRILTASVVAALAAAFTVMVAAALAAPAAAAPKPFPVCIEMGGQAGPEIAGSMVVWTDNRNSNLDIYGRNLSTGRNYAVCTNSAQQDNPALTRYVTTDAIVHYVAVWVDKRNHPSDEASDIYGRDITTGQRFKVAGGKTVKWFPDIVGTWVVWLEADTVAGPYRVKARDLAAQKTSVVGATGILSPPAVDMRMIGTRSVPTVVYTSGNGNIRGRNLPSGRRFVVSARSSFEWMPDISRNRVVWWETGERILLKDLKTGKRLFVHSGARPRINGELVTWDGGGHGGEFVISYVKNAPIYVRNAVHGGNVVTIAQAHLTCLFPAISGRRLVWEAGSADRDWPHTHIYGARLR